MTTIIRSSNYRLTSAIRVHLSRRFISALKRFQDRISLVEVTINEVDGVGPKGRGVEVVVEISLHDMGKEVVTMSSFEPYSAINIAAKRARRAVKRAIRHHDTVDHYGLRALAGFAPRRAVLESS